MQQYISQYNNYESYTYINSSKEINDQDPEFKIGSIIRISKYRNIIAKGYIPNWSDFFIIKIIKNTCRGHMLLVILKAKKLLERFTKKNCKELIKKVQI